MGGVFFLREKEEFGEKVKYSREGMWVLKSTATIFFFIFIFILVGSTSKYTA